MSKGAGKVNPKERLPIKDYRWKVEGGGYFPIPGFEKLGTGSEEKTRLCSMPYHLHSPTPIPAYFAIVLRSIMMYEC